jgi:hypothetical protein
MDCCGTMYWQSEARTIVNPKIINHHHGSHQSFEKDGRRLILIDSLGFRVQGLERRLVLVDS